MMEEKYPVFRNLIHGGNKKLVLPLILTFLLGFSGPLLSRYLLVDISGPFTIAWLLLYLVRFKQKEPKTILDRIKLVVIICYTLIFLDARYFHFTNELLLVAAPTLLMFTYYFDRIIVKIMKPFAVVLNMLFFLVSIFFVVFANIQTKLAKEQEQIANSLATESVRLKEQAEMEAASALTAQLEAERLLAELEDCQGK